MPKPLQKEAKLRNNPDFEPYGRSFILDECCLFGSAFERDHTLIYSQISPWNKELGRRLLYVIRPWFSRFEGLWKTTLITHIELGVVKSAEYRVISSNFRNGINIVIG
ncbi:uncharacterized protein FFC1_00001 [Fusarium fujikuroi]|nr:uncharacterized protein FFC1_00001 [Fusarium fujikuroi]